MLKQRLITALILIPIFVLLIFFLPQKYFLVLTLGLVFMGAWEWSRLLGVKPFLLRLCYPVLMMGLIPLFLFLNVQITLLIALVWWSMAFVLVIMYPNGSQLWGKSIFWRGLMGFFVLIPAFRALNFLRDTDIFGINHGPYVLLYLFVIIWGADSGAYFAGKKFGKRKLAPQVSPGKTYEGMIGALLTTLILSPGLCLLYVKPYPEMYMVITLVIVTVLFSILGDLFESMLKRNVGIKDSGRLIPGHGGLLDRIDSLTAAAPIFALGCILMLKIFH
jgi:phosphatidate cytidylyltransferase